MIITSIKKNSNLDNIQNRDLYLKKSVLSVDCGEIPLSITDSCRLLCINLFSYVENPFTDKALFNMDLFAQHAQYAQRFMDDIVDLEEEKIDKIISKINSDPEDANTKSVELVLWNDIKYSLLTGRRTGLGITAEADMLAALGMTYGTDIANQFCESVHKTLAVNALRSSIQLAKERGPFKCWKYELEKDNPFLERLFDSLSEKEYNDYVTYGRRNIAMLTVAPTGSVSVVAQTSSGIEPVFMLHYTRRRKINPNDKDTRTDFVDDSGDHWEEYQVLHPKFKMWVDKEGKYDNIEKMSDDDIEKIASKSPYYMATAPELDWNQRVKFQGMINQYVDHSISSTVNLPEKVTVDHVNQLFIDAWKSGCKGLTIYRDKSRTGVLISNTENKVNVFKENHAPKRPHSLPCDIIRFTNKGEKWIGFLGLYDNKPYEVFTGLAELVTIPNYLQSAHIVKAKNGVGNVYNLLWKDKDGFEQEFKGLSRAFNREYWNIGRLVSAILRHGMPIPNVIMLIDKLEIDGTEITSWKNGVKRMLKKYIHDGTVVHGQACFECQSDKMMYKDGCMMCSNCGWSKCD